MTITVIDDQNDLTPGGGDEGVIHEMEASLTGTTYLAIALSNTPLGGIRALGTQRIVITDVDPGDDDDFDLGTTLTAITLAGAGSSVINEGAVKSETAAAVLISGAAGSVQNQGTIESAAGTGAAIQFSGGGTSTVTNATGKMIKGAKGTEISSTSSAAKLELLNGGTIEATGLAIIGGGGNDRIVNTGILKTTSAAAEAALIDLGAGDDFYDGRLGTATGGIVKLGDGQDIAFGGSGNETFSGGKGTNILDGGDGVGDTVDYSDATATNTVVGVTVNLGLTFSQSTNYSSDLLLNIENVTGSAFNDTLIGNGLNNILKGGGSDDTLDGGMGSDTLDGGVGNNTVKFSSSTAATVDLSHAAAQDTGYGTDLLIGIRNLEGGSGADKFTGNGENNRLVGNGGNDTLKGGGGDDTLEGGTGRNTAEFSGSRGDYSIDDTGSGTFRITDNQTGRDGVDTVKDIRFVKFGDGQIIALTNGTPTSITPSTVTVSEGAAVGTNVTTLFGQDPDGDTLTFSLVSDAGGLFRISDGKLVLNRTLDYEAAPQHSVTVKASDGWGGELTKVVTITVRNVATETVPLVKMGTTAAEQVVGEEGNDQLYGLAGNDTIFGQGGSDKLWGGAGNDTLLGGTGNDIFVFDVKPNVKSNLDYVYDFNVKDDTIHLSKKFFSKLAKKGSLSSDAFVVGDRFKDADDRILYHKKAGALFYDPDGNGAAKAVQFATIGKKLGISHKDFYVI